VEDDLVIAELVASELRARDFAVEVAPTGLSGLELATAREFDVIITDRVLPGLDGLELIGRLRERGVLTPVLVLSAIGDVQERIRGLRAGGDDYLTKPFDVDELAARLEALLRRATQRPDAARETTVRAGSVVIDLLERTARRGDRLIELLPREFKLLEYMLRRPNQTLTRAMMLQDVWQYRYVPETNLVDVHIGKLRRKLTVAGERELIFGMRGVGFIFVPDERPPTD
jgi:two-component system OmpR family response regulator